MSFHVAAVDWMVSTFSVPTMGLTYLIRQHVSAEIAQRKLELLQAVVDGDLDGDEGVLRDGVVVVT